MSKAQVDEEAALHAAKQDLTTLASPEYWRKVCPTLHVNDSNFQAARLGRKASTLTSSADCGDVKKRLVEEGFAGMSPKDLRWSVDFPTLAAAVQRLDRCGWPPTFLALYDEAWAMALDAAEVMKEAAGNSMCMDIVGFMVDPSKTSGFSPHRDRQPEDWMPKGVPEDVAGTFKADGVAKYVTLWAALTDASPENSCLHFIPKSCDPGYIAGDTEDGDPLAKCFARKDAYQYIRAMPVSQGGCTFHTHRIIHWGNSGRASYRGPPRIALSFGFSTEDFEPPYFSPKALPFPALSLRLALCSAQVLNYATLSAGDAKGWIALAGGMANATASRLNQLHKLFQKQAKAFHPTYRKEIAKKFVASFMECSNREVTCTKLKEDVQEAMDQLKDVSAADQSKPGSKKRKKPVAPAPPSDSDDDDDALEAMLQAEAEAGEVLFHDDFDLLNGDGDGDGEGATDFFAFGKKGKRAGRRKAAGHRNQKEAGKAPANAENGLARPAKKRKKKLA